MKIRNIIFIIFLTILLILGCEKATNPQYKIERSSCNSCGNCLQVCPVDAIEFGTDGKAVIDQTKCNQCGQCILVCPQDAIN